MLKRSRLSEIIRIVLGEQLDIRLTVEVNFMSQKYISCGGHNIPHTSSEQTVSATKGVVGSGTA